MAKARITSETKTEDFNTELEQNCLGFSVENRGNSILNLLIDGATSLELPANTSREFPYLPGFFYSGKVKGTFSPDPELPDGTDQKNVFTLIQTKATELNC